MERLISADYFKKQITEMTLEGKIEPEKGFALLQLINIQPTAYKLDEVVKQLEELKTINVDTGLGMTIETLRKDVVLNIVEGGEINND